MTPNVTVSFGGLSAEARLPGWTTPFVVRLADRFLIEAANLPGPALRVVKSEAGVAVVDEAGDAFAREYGSHDAPAAPRLGAVAQRLRSGA